GGQNTVHRLVVSASGGAPGVGPADVWAIRSRSVAVPFEGLWNPHEPPRRSPAPGGLLAYRGRFPGADSDWPSNRSLFSRAAGERHGGAAPRSGCSCPCGRWYIASVVLLRTVDG